MKGHILKVKGKGGKKIPGNSRLEEIHSGGEGRSFHHEGDVGNWEGPHIPCEEPKVPSGIIKIIPREKRKMGPPRAVVR